MDRNAPQIRALGSTSVFPAQLSLQRSGANQRHQDIQLGDEVGAVIDVDLECAQLLAARAQRDAKARSG